jgi:hypothetical protein
MQSEKCRMQREEVCRFHFGFGLAYLQPGLRASAPATVVARRGDTPVSTIVQARLQLFDDPVDLALWRAVE